MKQDTTMREGWEEPTCAVGGHSRECQCQKTYAALHPERHGVADACIYPYRVEMIGGAITALLRERDEEIVRLRAAAWLAGEDIGFWAQGGEVFVLACNDTFGYACADCEEIPLVDAPRAKAVYQAEGWPGIVRWIAEVRGSRPLKEVEASMSKFDAMRDRCEKAEAALDKIVEIDDGPFDGAMGDEVIERMARIAREARG